MIVIKIFRIRTYLPQILATITTTVLLLDIGLSISYPAVVISALTGLNSKNNPNETLHMTPVQASWMGSISYLGKMFGSLTCGFASEYFGRRNAMILINIPHLFTFYLFYYSTSMWKLFVANWLLGFGSGYLKAPSTTYMTEISEVSVRGVLVSFTSIAVTFGPVLIFLLGNLTEWRNIALYSAIVQIIVTIMLICLPESPLWLLSKQHDEKALKSLRWLRGWVSQKIIQSEFDSLKRHKDASNSCNDCKKATVDCTHIDAPNVWQTMKELIRKRTLKPFIILFTMGIVTFFSGTHHLNAYMVQILTAYKSPIDPNWATVIVSCIGLCGTFVGIIGLKVFGRRKLYLVAVCGATLSTLLLSIYGFVHLPSNIKSYERKTFLNDLHQNETTHLPFITFCAMRLFTTITLLVPFSMLGEMYSQKSRSLATSATTVTNNIMTFIAINSFYNLEFWFNLPITLAIYSAIGTIGFIVVYKILPETEGRTLEDIELHFADNNRKLTDHYIVRSSDKQLQQEVY